MPLSGKEVSLRISIRQNRPTVISRRCQALLNSSLQWLLDNNFLHRQTPGRLHLLMVQRDDTKFF